MRDLIAEKVRATDGRISAKRLLLPARAAGYGGSARNFRWAVAEAKRRWQRQRRAFRPCVGVPGEHLIIDWCTEGGWQIFCAVLPWSRCASCGWRGTSAHPPRCGCWPECLEEMGGTPKVVLTDRMGCLNGGVVANVVVPTPDFVRFATHFGFRPDFCEAADPESKGVVEALCRYTQQDLVVPADAWASEAQANDACRSWCHEVNGARGILRPRPSRRSASSRSGRVVPGITVLAPAAAPG